MSNYYTKCSFTVNLPDPDAIAYAVSIWNACQLAWDDECPDTERSLVPEDLLKTAATEGVGVEIEADGDNRIWIHGDNTCIYWVEAFVQHLLQKYDLPEIVAVEISFDCSKARLDAYGGGIVLISRDSIHRAFTKDQDLALPVNASDRLTLLEIACWALQGLNREQIMSKLDLSDAHADELLVALKKYLKA
jgi:hypothetical protein